MRTAHLPQLPPAKERSAKNSSWGDRPTFLLASRLIVRAHDETVRWLESGRKPQESYCERYERQDRSPNCIVAVVPGVHSREDRPSGSRAYRRGGLRDRGGGTTARRS